jgi:hypothetical protein
LQIYWGHWTTWLSVGVGLTVTLVSFVILYRRAARYRRLAAFSREEDLPWDELLEVLRARNDELAAVGGLSEDLPPRELLKLLLGRLPAARRRPDLTVGEQQFLQGGAAERRANRRRWGNPTEVQLTSPMRPDRVYGLVINRSTGGVAVFIDEEIKPGLFFQVRSAEAPYYVPAVDIEVKYCRKVGKNFVAGCQFRGAIPWNARVWFG